MVSMELLRFSKAVSKTQLKKAHGHKKRKLYKLRGHIEVYELLRNPGTRKYKILLSN